MTEDSEPPIRLGIVGCGAVARISHLKALANLPQFDVRFLCDTNSRAAEMARGMYGLRSTVTTRFQDLAGKVDAALVCVLPGLHREITVPLLAMGLDVLCEKPIATSSADAVAIVEAARQAGRIVAVGQTCRCHKNMWILRKLLELDFLGDLESVTAQFGNVLTWPLSSAAYFDRNVTRGGVMFAAGVHVVDLVVWLFGEIDQLDFEDDSHGGVETNGIVRGTVRAGGRQVPCKIAASWTHDMRNGIRVVGSNGEAEATFTKSDVLTVRQRVKGHPIRMEISSAGIEMPLSADNPFEAQLEDFASAVRLRRPPITPVESTLAPLRVIEQAYAVRRSMSQPWVELPLVAS